MAINLGDGYEECSLEKYDCHNCNKQFIVGTEFIDGAKISCPYCESKLVKKIVWTYDDDLKDMDLGCLSLIRDMELIKLMKGEN